MKDRYIREGTEIIMGEYIIPRDNYTSLLNRQRRERVERLVQSKHHEEEERRPSSSSISDVQNCQPSFNYIAPMSNEHDITELTWENGHLAFHEFNGLFPPTCPTKPLHTWERTGDTLESVVQLATTGGNRRHTTTSTNTNPVDNNSSKHKNDVVIPDVVGSVVASSGGGGVKYCSQTQSSSAHQLQLSVANDQMNCSSGAKSSFFSFSGEDLQDQRACASASAVFCGENTNRSDNDTTVMTGASLDSSKMVTDEDSASDRVLLGKEQQMKVETITGRTSATRRRRAAAIHNQSERKRRDRINQKMKALQKLVPRASKTDKASMLDEVIEYLKQLQAQVQMMASARTMSQFMMPLGMQQQLQMSILAQMGAEIDPRSVNAAMTTSMPQHLTPGVHSSCQLVASASPFATPSFLVPSMVPIHQPNQDPKNSASNAMQNPYHAFLAQSMDMEMYNRMAAVYRQQMHQAMGAITGDQHLQSNFIHQGSTLR